VLPHQPYWEQQFPKPLPMQVYGVPVPQVASGLFVFEEVGAELVLVFVDDDDDVDVDDDFDDDDDDEDDDFDDDDDEDDDDDDFDDDVDDDLVELEEVVPPEHVPERGLQPAPQ